MKLMKAFQIEHDYQRHRERLYFIRSLDAKKKVSTNTHKNIDKINNYKKVKSNSFLHHDYNKERDITLKNEQLHRTLTKVYARDPTVAIEQDLVQHESRMMVRTNSQHSVRSHHSSRIVQENTKLVKKLSLAKSAYRKFREEKPKKRAITETGHKKEMANMLQNQLGCKPKVLFPSLRLNKHGDRRTLLAHRK